MEDRFYRRRLPHWRQDGAVYFVTWRVAPGKPALIHDERSAVVDAFAYFDTVRYLIDGYVVMDDHVHVIVVPHDGQALEKLTHSWKSFTASQFQKKFARLGSVWQDESFDRVIRHEKEFLQKLEYVLNNPYKRWPDLTDYPWVGYSLEDHPRRGLGRKGA